ncbi:hypothetical protein E4T44_07900 [Aureobasidium sp. EXF-8845]|nr:hypothetical protein E4T44_07900 [Aureobasidium sp. EXF-8845]KAI4848678.1 hypothetical protein E4T45_06231 [Aureobasidium sp. EXF-8846]
MTANPQPQPWNDASVHEFGRDFLTFSVQHGIHCVPIDDEELNRQADFYDVVSRLFERRLFLPADLAPEFILDCGSGGGTEWAEEVMEKSELGPGSSSSEDDDFACQVVVVDVFHTEGSSPGVVKKRWNLNEPFRYDQDELTRDKYDLVNSRFLTDCINAGRWGSYVQDLHDRLRGGGSPGWLQMLEAQFHIQSRSGRSLEHMGNAGFVNIAIEPKQLPVGEWHHDPRLREIGRDMKSVAVQTLRSLGVWHCRRSGMSEGDFEALIAGCEREVSDTSLRLYIPIFAVWGQRAEKGRKRDDPEDVKYVPDPSRRLPPPVDWA